jgi:hypothetical protein
VLEDADSLPRRPGNVPADLWHWIVAEVGIDVAQHVDPQVAVVLAARLAIRRGPPGTESAEALRLWPWFIDSSRRLAQQQEMMFIECALAAGWTHDQVRTAVLLDTTVELTEHLTELEHQIFREARPPQPYR